jgi:adenine C2-methylase RlmN of 23S rRNA A2503 and tRNA A37
LPNNLKVSHTLKTKTLIALLALFFVQYIEAQNKTTTIKILLQSAKADSVNNVTLQLFILPDTLLISTQIFSKAGNSFCNPFFKIHNNSILYWF